MSYHSAYLLSDDQDFFNRVGMCAETQPNLDYEWGIENRRSVASSPGFAEAYESALVAGIEEPGKDQSVISDGQILAAVQSVAGGGA